MTWRVDAWRPKKTSKNGCQAVVVGVQCFDKEWCGVGDGRGSVLWTKSIPHVQGDLRPWFCVSVWLMCEDVAREGFIVHAAGRSTSVFRIAASG
eukprot:105300-Rhodomonas_salina.2